MVFSTKVKAEIIGSKIADGNELSMLCGIILSAGTIIISNKQMTFNLVTENPMLLEYSAKLIRQLFPHSVLNLPSCGKKNKARYTLGLDAESAQEILLDCGILERDEFGRLAISLVGGNHVLIEREAKIAYLAGTFLGGGTISVPQTGVPGGRYHMEWSFASSNQADVVAQILAEEDIFAKIIERQGNYVVYIKGSEDISSAVGLMGATNCYLKLETQMVDRQMRNLVNRQSNCISANIDKSVSAGLKQIELIDQIETTIGLDALPKSLQEAAAVRKQHPEASLQELAEILQISKSAVNLRLRKLSSIAKELSSN